MPKGLPPSRQFEHKIELQANVQPVKVKAYRYPRSQKIEIELQVKNMLAD